MGDSLTDCLEKLLLSSEKLRCFLVSISVGVALNENLSISQVLERHEIHSDRFRDNSSDPVQVLWSGQLFASILFNSRVKVKV